MRLYPKPTVTSINSDIGILMKDSGSATDSIDDTRDLSSAAATFTLESVYGSVMPSQSPECFEEISRVAKEDKVERTLREME